MTTVTQEYVDSLAPIYQAIFRGFWEFNPTLRPEHPVAIQSLYSLLSDQYRFGEIEVALENLEKGGVVRREDEIFFSLTKLGEEIVQTLVGSDAVTVPPFSPPPTHGS